jgi:hypothetical protein
MKKLLLFVMLFTGLFSAEIKMGTLSITDKNSVRLYKNILNVTLETDTQEIYLVSSGFHPKIVSIKTNQRVAFINALKKYQAWEKKAVQMNVKLEKTMTNCPAYFFWKWGDEYHTTSYVNTISFIFFSQTTLRHQLVIYISKSTSTKNQFVDQFVEWYLDKDEVAQLLNYFDQKTIDSYIKKQKQKENVASEFN